MSDVPLFCCRLKQFNDFLVIIYNLINWVVLELFLPILFYFLVVLHVTEVLYTVHYITIDSVLINDVC